MLHGNEIFVAKTFGCWMWMLIFYYWSFYHFLLFPCFRYFVFLLILGNIVYNISIRNNIGVKSQKLRCLLQPAHLLVSLKIFIVQNICQCLWAHLRAVIFYSWVFIGAGAAINDLMADESFIDKIDLDQIEDDELVVSRPLLNRKRVVRSNFVLLNKDGE